MAEPENTNTAAGANGSAAPPPEPKLSQEDQDLIKMSEEVAAGAPPSDEEEHTTDDTGGQTADEGEEREAAASEDEEHETKAKKRERESAADRKRRARLSRQRDRAYIKQLEGRLSAVEAAAQAGSQRVVRDNVQRLGQSIEVARARKAEAEEALEAAIIAGDGKRARNATAVITEASIALDRLETAADDMQRRARQPRSQPAPMDPVAKRKAEDWQSRNSWYNPQSEDPAERRDSRIIDAIDTELTEQGYVPGSDDYWDELTAQARDAVPHRFRGATPPRRTNGDGRREVPSLAVGGSVASNGAAGASKRFVLSKEQVETIQAANAWDNPAKRARMIKYYRDYAREHAQDSK
jgi:hypothetical protein